MAIISIGAPSGFEAQKAGLEGNSLIKRLETAGGQLILYFDDVRLIIMLIPVSKMSHKYPNATYIFSRQCYDLNSVKLLLQMFYNYHNNAYFNIYIYNIIL